MDLERQLRDSLAARDPGAEFESAVLARLPERGAAPARRDRRRWPMALAATVLAAAFGLHWYGVQQRSASAHRQLLLALQITSYELDQVQQKLVSNGTQED